MYNICYDPAYTISVLTCTTIISYEFMLKSVKPSALILYRNYCLSKIKHGSIFALPWSAADRMTSALDTSKPPLRPNFSATKPVLRPPTIPPTQNIDTAMAHINVTCVWSVGLPSFLADITPPIHFSISCNDMEKITHPAYIVK